MYYEITVAKNRKHLFATAERSIRSLDSLLKILPLINEKFPESEGYQLSVSFHPEESTIFDPVKILKMGVPND
jgi:hypothetical protein